MKGASVCVSADKYLYRAFDRTDSRRQAYDGTGSSCCSREVSAEVRLLCEIATRLGRERYEENNEKNRINSISVGSGYY